MVAVVAVCSVMLTASPALAAGRRAVVLEGAHVFFVIAARREIELVGLVDQLGDARASKVIGSSVYNDHDEKVGSVDDLLVGRDGKINAVLSVGGFLGMNSKDVIVSFADVNVQKKDNSWWLSINETKDSLKAAQGFTYDRDSTTWRPEKS